MDALLAQIKTLTASADEAGRMKVIDGLRDLAISIESPEDTMQRIMYQHLSISIVRVGIDLKLFDLLAASESSMTTQQLAQKTSADSVLLARILRYLASVRMIKETGKDAFEATNVTKTLSNPAWQGGVHHYFDNVGPMFQDLPDFLADTKYQNITDNTKTVLQRSWKTDVPAFIWFQQHPQKFEYFNQYMAGQRGTLPTFVDVYPVEAETKGWSPEEPVFVDIGGGFGHQCALLKGKYPNLPGRVVLQDLPHATEHAIQTPGVDITVHDFFQPQPVKGAKYYYMRNILHDYPDDKCREILQNIISAMDANSKILIDEMCLPATDVHWQATQLDLTMMVALASMERTKEQWAALLESVGLKIQATFPYTTSLKDSIIVAVPK